MTSPAPVLHLVAGPNGAGKSTLFTHVIEPASGLQFINADVVAANRWPGEEAEHAYEAAQLAAEGRTACLSKRTSFATETVFSHPSKVELVQEAANCGYNVTLHVVMVPEELSVERVVDRVANRGHHVPEQKIRERWQRLWDYVADAIAIANTTLIYDNSQLGKPFKLVAAFKFGEPAMLPEWPAWTPAAIRATVSREQLQAVAEELLTPPVHRPEPTD